jgi:hypothetical protein
MTNSPPPVSSNTTLAQNNATYTAARGAPFARPGNPGPYGMTIPDNATAVVRNRREAAHMVLVNDFNAFEAAEEEIKTFIYATVKETWIKALRDTVTFYNNVTAYNMFEHLCTNSGGLHNVDLATLPADMLHYYATAEGIPEFILALENSWKKLSHGVVPMLDATLLATAHMQDSLSPLSRGHTCMGALTHSIKNVGSMANPLPCSRHCTKLSSQTESTPVWCSKSCYQHNH